MMEIYDFLLLFTAMLARKCCGSGMFIPDPDFSIPDPKTVTMGKDSRRNEIVEIKK